MKKIVIVGCGDIGCRLAKLAGQEGFPTVGFVRSEAGARAARRLGLSVLTGNLDRSAPSPALPTGGAVLFYFVPPPESGVEDRRLRTFLDGIAAGEEPEKIVYISTSGVYGDCGGALVSEETAPNPRTDRARRRLDAETALNGWGAKRRVAIVILRVPGIYGPGRLPIARVRSGEPVLREEEAPFTNRIHADDLARICLAAGQRGEAGDLFNVSDGEESTMTDYFNAVADALGAPRPPQISLAEARQILSPAMLSYLEESRRLDSRRMLRKLGVHLLYPTLREGLKASLP